MTDLPKKQGIKHLIDCVCFLQQFANKKEKVFYKFLVFSIIDEEDKVIPKFAQCNNCGLIHYVTEINKSSFTGKDSSRSVQTIEDVRYSLSKETREILEEYDVLLPIWEEAAFIVENKLWNSFVVLSSEEVEGFKNFKLLRFLGDNIFKIESVTEQTKTDRNI